MESNNQYEELLRGIKAMQALCIKVIKEAAQKGEWQAAAWFLERTDPERWGKK